MSRVVPALQTVLRNMQDETEGYSKLKEILFYPDWHFKESGSGISDLDMEPLVWFYLRPWFGRLWIVQEAAVSQTSVCICGNSEASLVGVLDVATWV